MAGLKLIIPLCLVTLMSLSIGMVEAGPMTDLANAFLSKSPSDMKLADGLPPKLKAKLPPSIVEKLSKISVADVKKALKDLKQLLKDLMSGKVKPEEFMKKLKEISPPITELLKDAKQKISDKLASMIAPPSGRRKRDAVTDLMNKIIKAILDFLNPPKDNPWKKLKEKIIKKLKELQMKLDPPKPDSLMQQMANALSKQFPELKPFFQKPAVTKALGISPPPV